jgi:hypothetical protein
MERRPLDLEGGAPELDLDLVEAEGALLGGCQGVGRLAHGDEVRTRGGLQTPLLQVSAWRFGPAWRLVVA